LNQKSIFGGPIGGGQKEIAQAQDALLNGKMDACAMHLSQAMDAGTMK
jgi:hypothetical protein